MQCQWKTPATGVQPLIARIMRGAAESSAIARSCKPGPYACLPVDPGIGKPAGSQAKHSASSSRLAGAIIQACQHVGLAGLWLFFIRVTGQRGRGHDASLSENISPADVLMNIKSSRYEPLELIIKAYYCSFKQNVVVAHPLPWLRPSHRRSAAMMSRRSAHLPEG